MNYQQIKLIEDDYERAYQLVSLKFKDKTDKDRTEGTDGRPEAISAFSADAAAEEAAASGGDRRHYRQGRGVPRQGARRPREPR